MSLTRPLDNRTTWVAIALVALIIGLWPLAAPTAQASPVYFAATGHWYEVVKSPAYRWPWTSARDAAVARGGYLACIGSSAENDFVVSILPSDRTSTAIGGYEVSEGNWAWVSGEPLVYSNWQPGEPNNSWGGTEAYIYLGYYGNQWNDGTIDGVVEYVVEYDSDPAEATYFPATGHWYQVVPCPSPQGPYFLWTTARDAAAAKGGYLACIESNEENAFVQSLIPSGYGGLALGGYETTEGNWNWVSGEPFEYTNWLAGEPNNGGGTEQYILARASGAWTDGNDCCADCYVVEYERDPTSHDEPPIAVLKASYSGGSAGTDLSSCGFEVTFSLLGTTQGMDSYELEFGDGASESAIISTDNPISHSYHSSGVFTATLHVCNSGSLCSESSVRVYVSDFGYGVDNHSFANDDSLDSYAKTHSSFIEIVRDELPLLSQKNLMRLALWFGKKEGFCSGFAGTEIDYYSHVRDVPCANQPVDCPEQPLCNNTFDLQECNAQAVDEIVEGFAWAALKQLNQMLRGEYTKVSDQTAMTLFVEQIGERLKDNEVTFLSLTDKETLEFRNMFWHAVVAIGMVENEDGHVEIAIANNLNRSRNCDLNPPSDKLTYSSGSTGMALELWQEDDDYELTSPQEIHSLAALEAGVTMPTLDALAVNALLTDPIIAGITNVFFAFIVGSPVTTLVIADDGRKLGVDSSGTVWSEISGAIITSLPSGYPAGSYGVPEAILYLLPRNAGYRVEHRGIASGRLHQEVLFDDSRDSLVYFRFSDSISEGDAVTTFLGLDPTIVKSCKRSGEETVELLPTYYDVALQYTDISGSVTYAGAGLAGVPVSLSTYDGTIIRTCTTELNGQFHFDWVANGYYTIQISTPLGFIAEAEVIELSLGGLPEEVSFNLIELELVPQQRTRGYWAHQLLKAVQNKPQDFSLADFTRFASLIDQHFNQNQLNPVDFYQVPQPASQSDSLEVLRKLLHMMNTTDDEPLLKRLAKSELMALMLNVVSGKVSQTYPITKDGLTISQVITYCDLLVNDEIDVADDGGPGCGSPWARYIRASFILTMANCNIKVPADMIPADIIQIAYKRHQSDLLPEGFVLNQNFPNPFNPTTEISFSLPNAGEVRLEVFNMLGQKVATLFSGHLDAGNHTVTWDASGQSSGVYLYRLEAGTYTDTKKMLLLK